MHKDQHLLILGSYCINERKDKPIRLGLGFAGDEEINFYSCSVKFVEEPLDEVYDWRTDVMSDSWDAVLARKRLRAVPDALVCDALLDQTIRRPTRRATRPSGRATHSAATGGCTTRRRAHAATSR